MLWFIVWSVLVVAAIAVLAVLALWLWRRAKALGAQLASTSERLGEVARIPPPT